MNIYSLLYQIDELSVQGNETSNFKAPTNSLIKKVLEMKSSLSNVTYLGYRL